jgi:hypothetical protein
MSGRWKESCGISSPRSLEKSLHLYLFPLSI